MAPPRNEQSYKLDAMHLEDVPASRSDEAELSIWKTLIQNPIIIACCLFANIGAFMYGFDNLALSLCLSMVPFQMQFGTPTQTATGTSYVIPAYWQSLWGSLSQVATMIGAMFIATVTDRFGRRYGFLLASLFSFAGVAVVYIASQNGVFLAGKMINAIGLGMAIATGQTYVSEIAPMRVRGIALSAYTFSMNLGYLVAASIAFKRVTIMDSSAYKVLFASEWTWPGLLLLGVLIIPESPYYLLRRGNDEKAGASLRRLRGKNTDVAVLLEDMNTLVATENSTAALAKESSWKELFQGDNWRRTRIILYANGLAQMIGASFNSDGPYFMISAGLSPTQTAMMVEMGIGFGIFSSVVTFFCMARFGRRPIALFGVGAAAMMFFMMGVAGCFSSKTALWVIGVSLQLNWFVLGPSIGPTMAVAGEISEIRLRSKSQSVGFMFNYFYSTVWNVVVPYMFNTDEGNLGGKMGWIFFATCLIAFALLYLELPETKDRSFAAIDELFKKRVPTREFAAYQVETQLIE